MIKPVLRFEMEGIKHTVQHMFNEHNNELSRMVTNEIEQQLSQEWLQLEITKNVSTCMEKAVKDVSNNWKLQNAITNLIGDAVAELVEKKND